MRVTPYSALILVLLLPSILYAQLQDIAGCPKCFKNQVPLDPARGWHEGRRKVNVAIQVGYGTGSWATVQGTSEPNGRIVQGAAYAIQWWNNAEDTTSNPPQKIPYYFTTLPAATSDLSQVDILIVKMPILNEANELNPPGKMETGGVRPYKLFVREDMVESMTSGGLGSLISHEIAHRIGLVNSYDDDGSAKYGGPRHAETLTA